MQKENIERLAPLTEEEKQIFKRATDRRRLNGIRLKRFTILADESQVAALNEVFESWIIRFGKQLAVDHLIRIMAQIESRMQDKEHARRSDQDR